MARDTIVVVSENRRRDIENYIAQLPDILAGRVSDAYGLTKIVNARVAFTMLGFIDEAFDQKGRGQVDEAGESWAPLSPAYLAYKRPVTGRQPPKAGGLAPGVNKKTGKQHDGYLKKRELEQWKARYAHVLKWAMLQYDPAEAKAIAAASAWNMLKNQGVKTKLGTFGERVAGVDYQTLVDTGNLRKSLLPGNFREGDYKPGSSDQIYEQGQGYVAIGSRDRTAAFHHNGRGTRQRRLWPKSIPSPWWREVLGQVRGGVSLFATFFGGRTA